jgi:hypothetical protein
MTEDELTSAIETTMQAAHQACQPYYLQLARLWLPGAPALRSETLISSTPIGTHARVDRLSIALMVDPAPAPVVA